MPRSRKRNRVGRNNMTRVLGQRGFSVSVGEIYNPGPVNVGEAEISDKTRKVMMQNRSDSPPEERPEEVLIAAGLIKQGGGETHAKNAKQNYRLLRKPYKKLGVGRSH